MTESRNENLDDTVSQSGWLFADLLVALSVIFLATISFIPSGTMRDGDFPASNSIESEGFSAKYQVISATKLINDLTVFRQENAIPEYLNVIHLQIIGSELSSDKRPGVLDALELSVEVQNTGDESLRNASISLSTDKKLKPGEIVVRAVFGKTIQKS